jgi:hypothetical protein
VRQRRVGLRRRAVPWRRADPSDAAPAPAGCRRVVGRHVPDRAAVQGAVVEPVREQEDAEGLGPVCRCAGKGSPGRHRARAQASEVALATAWRRGALEQLAPCGLRGSREEGEREADVEEDRCDAVSVQSLDGQRVGTESLSAATPEERRRVLPVRSPGLLWTVSALGRGCC